MDWGTQCCYSNDIFITQKTYMKRHSRSSRWLLTVFCLNQKNRQIFLLCFVSPVSWFEITQWNSTATGKTCVLGVPWIFFQLRAKSITQKDNRLHNPVVRNNQIWPVQKVSIYSALPHIRCDIIVYKEQIYNKNKPHCLSYRFFISSNTVTCFLLLHFYFLFLMSW